MVVKMLLLISSIKDAQNQLLARSVEGLSAIIAQQSSAVSGAYLATVENTATGNAVIDDETQEIVYRDYCDVSFAAATPKGLVVPVLRNAEAMSFKDVESNITLLAEKAKNNQLAIEDMVGGTFTISNGGVFGSLYGTPIINMPQCAILGMHATKVRGY